MWLLELSSRKASDFPNVDIALYFVSTSGEIAKEEQHHPENLSGAMGYTLFCPLKIERLAENDFELAVRLTRPGA